MTTRSTQSLDPATSIVTGRETVTIHNNSDSVMHSLPDRDPTDNIWPRAVLAPPMIKVR
jgi:hypothetical protein